MTDAVIAKQTTQTEAIKLTNTKPFVWGGVALLIYMLLVAVGMVSSGFKLATGGAAGAEQLFAFASSPVLGLLAGALATALVQSSSTVTSIIVGLAAGGLPVSMAVPMIMGANIGTTITNTIVSLGHIRNGEEFKRAFAASTVHDFFNWMAVLILLPLELATGFLEKAGSYIASLLAGGPDMHMSGYNFMKMITKPVIKSVAEMMTPLSSTMGGIMMILIGVAVIMLSVTWLGKLLRQVLVGRAKNILKSAVGRGPISGICSGAAVTVLVQSSSTTTSLIVPLAGNGFFKLREVYPFTLGANIGTTITALLAATAVTGPLAGAALTIALVHLLFNVSAVVGIYSVPFLRNIPLKLSESLAELAVKRKFLALAYIASAFFVIPGLLLLIVG
ncbi:Na/Pi symporter [Endozoicomonadaceae bacterium StTr2]